MKKPKTVKKVQDFLRASKIGRSGFAQSKLGKKLGINDRRSGKDRREKPYLAEDVYKGNYGGYYYQDRNPDKSRRRRHAIVSDEKHVTVKRQAGDKVEIVTDRRRPKKK